LDFNFLDANAAAALLALMEAQGFTTIMKPPDPRPSSWPVGRLVFAVPERALLVAVQEPVKSGFWRGNTWIVVAQPTHAPTRGLDLALEGACDVQVDWERHLREESAPSGMPPSRRYCGYEFRLLTFTSAGSPLSVDRWVVAMAKARDFLVGRLEPGPQISTLPVDMLTPGEDPGFWSTDLALPVLERLGEMVTGGITMGFGEDRRVLWPRP
jgi:hypothetical protein